MRAEEEKMMKKRDSLKPFIREAIRLRKKGFEVFYVVKYTEKETLSQRQATR